MPHKCELVPHLPHTDIGVTKYDLVANMVHEGKQPCEGSYRLHVHRKVEEIW